MGDIVINSKGQTLVELPGEEVTGIDTHLMLVIPHDALPRHVPSILMFVHDAAKKMEEAGRTLSITLRIVDENGNVIKEEAEIRPARIMVEEFDAVPENYGLNDDCRKNRSSICYDVSGFKKIVFDILIAARDNEPAWAAEEAPNVTAPKGSSFLLFPKDVMKEFDDLSTEEQAESIDDYGFLTVLFARENKDLYSADIPPGGLMIVPLDDFYTQYYKGAAGVSLGSVGRVLYDSLLTRTPCEEVKALNRLLELVPNMNGGTALLNEARRFVQDSLVFQMATRSGECTIDGAKTAVDLMLDLCPTDPDRLSETPCRTSLRKSMALVLPCGDPYRRLPEELIGDASAYYDMMAELAKEDRRAAIESIKMSLRSDRENTEIAYWSYLKEMNVTLPEAFEALLSMDHIVFYRASEIFAPVFEGFRSLDHESRMKVLVDLREQLIRFAAGEKNSHRHWEAIADFIYGTFTGFDGDTEARDFLARAVIDALCSIGNERYDWDKGPGHGAVWSIMATLLSKASGGYLLRYPEELERSYRWVASLTGVMAIIMVNARPSIMNALLSVMDEKMRKKMIKVTASSVAEQILTVYSQKELFEQDDLVQKLGFLREFNSFSTWNDMLTAEGMAAVAVAVANSDISKGDFLAVLMPVIEAMMSGSFTKDERLGFIERVMKDADDPHIVAALILNCFKNADNLTWRFDHGETEQAARLMADILDMRAAMAEDLPIVGAPLDPDNSRYVRRILRSVADGDVEGLLQMMFIGSGGSGGHSYIREIPMPFWPMDKDSSGFLVPLPVVKDINCPLAASRVNNSFKIVIGGPNKWSFWEDIPPTPKFFADVVKTSFEMAGRESLRNVEFLFSFFSKPANNVFYDDALLGDFLEERLAGLLGKIGDGDNLSLWALHASTLIKLMPLERRLRLFKSVSKEYLEAAEKAKNGMPLGDISLVMEQAGLAMRTSLELQVALPVLNFVGPRLNAEMPSDDPGFNGMIMGMSDVIGKLNEDEQIRIIGMVFDECMMAFKDDALKLFDRLYSPKEGETMHDGDFKRRVGRRLANAKATEGAFVFIGNYASFQRGYMEEARFESSMEMVVGASLAYLDGEVTMTLRDLQKMIFTLSNNIIFEGYNADDKLVDMLISWFVKLGETGSPDMLFTALKPMIQLIQSEDIPTANRVRMEHFNGIIRLHFAEIITAILTGEDVKEENKQAIAARFLKLAEMCVDQCSFSLRDEFKKIRAACESVLKP